MDHSSPLDSSQGLDRTLEFESKFMFPDGTVLAATPTSKSIKAKVAAITGKGREMASSSAERPPSEGLLNSAADRILRGSALMKDPSSVDITSHSQGHKDECEESLRSNQAFINDFKDTLQLITDSSPDTARPPTTSSMGGGSSGASEEEKRSAQFDVESILRRNRRKLGILGKAVGERGGGGNVKSGFEGEVDLATMVDNMKNISSRPSSSSSTRPGTSFSTIYPQLSPRADSAGARQTRDMRHRQHQYDRPPIIPPRLPVFSPRLDGGEGSNTDSGYLDSYLASKGRSILDSGRIMDREREVGDEDQDRYSEFGL